jgi:hypothetical protein
LKVEGAEDVVLDCGEDEMEPLDGEKKPTNDAS